jgi:hypothetical protein
LVLAESLASPAPSRAILIVNVRRMLNAFM